MSFNNFYSQLSCKKSGFTYYCVPKSKFNKIRDKEDKTLSPQTILSHGILRDQQLLEKKFLSDLSC